VPIARSALERSAATISEAQSGARDQILHCARYQDLVSTGKRRDPRADMYSNAADIVADHFALACMEAGANSNPVWPDLLGNGAGAADAAGRAVESGKNAVASALNLITAKALEIASDSSVMTVKQVAPAVVAERDRFLGRPDDVCKQYRGEHSINRDRRS
jgi:hypothetical protein